MENKLTTGIIGLISLLAVFGGTIYFTPELGRVAFLLRNSSPEK